MKKAKNKLNLNMANTRNTVLFSVFLFLTLLFSVKGVWGNPSPQVIETQLKSEAKPFELSPERGRFALLTSIVDFKSLYFPTEVARYVIPDLGYHNGKYVSLFPAGVSFFAIPFYIIGKYLNLGQVFVFGVSALFATLNAVLILKIIEKLTKNWFAGAAASLTFLYATSALSYAGTLYQHHFTTFFILACLYLVISETKKYTALLVGFLAGISIFVEYNNAIFLLPILVGLVFKHLNFIIKKNKLQLTLNGYLFLAIIGFAIGIAPNFYYSYKAYGNPLQMAGTVRNITKLESEQGPGRETSPAEITGEQSASGFFDIYKIPQGLSVLLSSRDRGVIWFSPVILLSLFGIRSLYRRNRFETIVIISTVSIILLLYGMWGDPWGGWAFGPRYLIPMFALSAILLGEALTIFSRKNWFNLLFVSLFVYSLVINLSGALTTSQIPPTKEDFSRRYPQPTYIYNYDLILEGKSSSFVYNSFISKYISLKNFYWINFAVISLALALLFYKSQPAEKADKSQKTK